MTPADPDDSRRRRLGMFVVIAGASALATLIATGLLMNIFERAPQEAARILGESINFARKGQIAIRDGKAAVVKPPDKVRS